MLSVLLRYTDSDYPFGIVKLFLQILKFYIGEEEGILGGLDDSGG